MTQCTNQVDPLDHTIFNLLCSLPLCWKKFNSDSYTGMEQRAIMLLLYAGFVEIRFQVRVTMDKQKRAAEMTMALTGEYHAKDIWSPILKLMPKWCDKQGRTRGRSWILSTPQQIRLTGEGQRIRQEYGEQTPENPSIICNFVSKYGFSLSKRSAPPTIRITCYNMYKRPRRESGPPDSNAFASSNTTTDTITINNVIDVNQLANSDWVVVNREKHEVKSNPTSDAQANTSFKQENSEKNTNREPPPDMKPSISLAGASFERVEREHPELCPSANRSMRYSKAQWNYIKEYYDDLYPLDANGISTMPSFDTWSRYVRDYLRHTDGSKNSPRHGRPHGRSIILAKDTDQSRRSHS